MVGGVWWYGVRDLDFLEPPPEEVLEGIRGRVAASVVPADSTLEGEKLRQEIEEAKLAAAAERRAPKVQLGNLELPPALQEYSDAVPKTGAHFIELAGQLEAKGEFQRALLAWERVIDLAKANEQEIETALASIRRIRPTLPDWNTDLEKAITITLHAGTGKDAATLLAPALDQAAIELQKAGSGILRVVVRVTEGPNPPGATGPAPVAIWLTGQHPDSSSTDVMSFTLPAPEELQEQLLTTAFSLIRSYLGRSNTENPPPVDPAGREAMPNALHSHITRLSWQNLGQLLNHPAK